MCCSRFIAERHVHFDAFELETNLLLLRALKNDSVVAGGGAIEMELSKELRTYAKSIHGKCNTCF